MLKRRAVLAAATVLAAPRIAVGQGARVLKMVPQVNLTSLDPIWTDTSYAGPPRRPDIAGMPPRPQSFPPEQPRRHQPV